MLLFMYVGSMAVLKFLSLNISIQGKKKLFQIACPKLLHPPLSICLFFGVK
jgi:hypothetical protein